MQALWAISLKGVEEIDSEVDAGLGIPLINEERKNIITVAFNAMIKSVLQQVRRDYEENKSCLYILIRWAEVPLSSTASRDFPLIINTELNIRSKSCGKSYHRRRKKLDTENCVIM